MRLIGYYALKERKGDIGTEDSPFDRQAMDAWVVAKEALRAMRAGERLVVCGGLNRFGAVLAQLAPRRLATRIAGALLSKMK